MTDGQDASGHRPRIAGRSRSRARALNYRHGFHAGNHTEVFKHPALIAVIELIGAKGKPFAVIDTHSGVGLHDLGSEMALRTREADSGIRRVAASRDPALRRYLDIVRSVGGDAIERYPGSPEIVRRLLGPRDRLVACELHPEDVVALRSHLAADRRASVHHRNGYEAMMALIPPPERRGVVFVDPPFEKAGEAQELSENLSRAVRKWESGTFVAWYPVKDEAVERTLRAVAPESRAKDALIARFLSRPYDRLQLSGGGILVLNPPWGLERKLQDICEALARSYDRAAWSVDCVKRDWRPVTASAPRRAARPS